MKFNSIGLGDIIEYILHFFGIRSWEGCGCDSRKAFLNNIVLYYPVWGTANG